MAITVTVLDTGGIQPFIFGSNVLRENIADNFATALNIILLLTGQLDGLMAAAGGVAQQNGIAHRIKGGGANAARTRQSLPPKRAARPRIVQSAPFPRWVIAETTLARAARCGGKPDVATE